MGKSHASSKMKVDTFSVSTFILPGAHRFFGVPLDLFGAVLSRSKAKQIQLVCGEVFTVRRPYFPVYLKCAATDNALRADDGIKIAATFVMWKNATCCAFPPIPGY
jgi:hypothetical protein